MDVSIIIVNYNTKKLTSECIDSILEKTSGISFEIILVDNASKDGSREFFCSDSRIRYYFLDKNIGFGAANNLGLEKASGRNILFLNSDTLLINNAIEILSDYLDKNPSVGACGGNLYNEDLTPGLSYRMYGPSIYGEVSRFFKFIPDKLIWGKNASFNHSRRPRNVFFVWGADLMAKKTVLDETGGFDTSFFMYYEDVELCARISRTYQISSVPDAKIIHLSGKSSEPNPNKERFIKEMNGNSKQIYLELTHSSFYIRIVKLLNSLTLATRLHRK